MAKRVNKTRRFRVVPLTVTLGVAIMVAVVFAVTHVGPARAAIGTDDVAAIGVGDLSSTAQLSSDAAGKFAEAESPVATDLTSSSTRTGYVVKTIGPSEAGSVSAGVVMDGDNVVVTRDEGWQQGTASAYTLACNDGYDATASGAKLTEDSMTVAVPSSRSYLLGRTVEIYYNGMTVTAKVTDTGGFAPLGRDLDLAGGVWRAFGATSTDNWGVRTVSYRFL